VAARPPAAVGGGEPVHVQEAARSGIDRDRHAEQVRRVALTLPGVAEIDSDGFDFRSPARGSSGPTPSSDQASRG
jgi:hypothetical protein